MKRLPLVLSSFLVLTACGTESGTVDGSSRYATLVLDVTYPYGFSYLSSVRELADGSVYAADPTNQVLLRIDLEAGSADTIGRQGPGPNEYNGPDGVFPLPGDSTLLVDLGNGRLTVIDPDGAFASSVPMSAQSDNGRLRTITPMFIDSEGNLYDSGFYDPEGPQDTTSLRRIDRNTRQETEVATSWHAPYARPGPGEKRPMLKPYDGWAVGMDGRVAVVRANGYSVDLYFTDGTVIHGSTNETERYPLGMQEIEREHDHMVTDAVTAYSMVGENGVQSMQMRRGLPEGRRPSADDFAWPETMPVFRGDRTMISPRGEVWVQRFMPEGVPGRIEVFDAHAVRVGYIEIPPRSRVIGFSEQGGSDIGVYVARTDDVGLVWLGRYSVATGEGDA